MQSYMNQQWTLEKKMILHWQWLQYQRVESIGTFTAVINETNVLSSFKGTPYLFRIQEIQVNISTLCLLYGRLYVNLVDYDSSLHYYSSPNISHHVFTTFKNKKKAWIQHIIKIHTHSNAMQLDVYYYCYCKQKIVYTKTLPRIKPSSGTPSTYHTYFTKAVNVPYCPRNKLCLCPFSICICICWIYFVRLSMFSMEPSWPLLLDPKP
jgi:hypothetical protein